MNPLLTRILTVLFLTFSGIGLHAQGVILHQMSTNFDTGQVFIEIDSNANNIWQIGTPSKTVFGSAHSLPRAILTDTLLPYPDNNLSTFTYTVSKDTTGPFWCMGEGHIIFDHKYDYEYQKDGGYIEVRYDTSSTWTNLLLDTDPMWVDGWSFTQDTIVGGIPAVTGTSNGWVHTEIIITWIMLVKFPGFHDSVSFRFVSRSDSVPTQQEGWMIDNLEISIIQCYGGLDDLTINMAPSKAIPNPSSGHTRIDFDAEDGKAYQLVVFDINGNNVISLRTHGQEEMLFDTSNLSRGEYIYVIKSDKRTLSMGKLIVN